jgi:hypothetical protein
MTMINRAAASLAIVPEVTTDEPTELTLADWSRPAWASHTSEIEDGYRITHGAEPVIVPVRDGEWRLTLEVADTVWIEGGRVTVTRSAPDITLTWSGECLTAAEALRYMPATDLRALTDAQLNLLAIADSETIR